jgi:hypothetical protein
VRLFFSVSIATILLLLEGDKSALAGGNQSKNPLSTGRSNMIGVVFEQPCGLVQVQIKA